MRFLFSLLFILTSTSLAAQSTGIVVRQALQEQGNIAYENNDVRFLESAAEKYETLLHDIQKAHRYIHLEYFRICNDSIGSQLLSLLKQKAQEGLEVRLLVDGYGNKRNPYPITSSQIDSLNAAGVKTTLFDPFRFPWINHIRTRDHRKIVIIDGTIVFTGGMNVGDYYLTGTKRTGPWRDMHVRLKGPVANAYQSIFSRMWEKVCGEHLDSLHYCSSNERGEGKQIVVVNREPGKSRKSMLKAYRTSIERAKHEIRIVNPYPTGVRAIRKALKRAMRRGVKVKVMASVRCDVPIVSDVIALELNKLAKKGCEVYYYEKGFHHSKVMTVDGEFCTVGTANLDSRSMHHDYEVNAFIFDSLSTTKLDSLFDKDKEGSFQLDYRKYKKHFPLGRRISGRIFYPLRGLF